MNDIPKVEDTLKISIFLYVIDFVDEELIGELARRSFQKNDKSDFTLQQSLLLRQKHQCVIQNFPMQYLWHLLFKGW